MYGYNISPERHFCTISGSLSRLPKRGSFDVKLKILECDVFTVSPIKVGGVEKIWIQWRKETLSHTHFDTINSLRYKIRTKEEEHKKGSNKFLELCPKTLFPSTSRNLLGTKWK